MFSIRGFRENRTKFEFEKGVGNFLAPKGVLSHCRTKTMKMNMKKTLLAAAVATAMMVPMTGAMAANEASKSTKLTYEVTQGYEWTVPSDVFFGKDAGVNQTAVNGSTDKSTVTVTKNVIAENKTLKIKIADDEDFKIKLTNGTTTLDYKVMKDGSVLTAGSEVLAVAAGTNTGSQALTFTLSTTTGAAEVAGTYEGTLTFAAAIE